MKNLATTILLAALAASCNPPPAPPPAQAPPPFTRQEELKRQIIEVEDKINLDAYNRFKWIGDELGCNEFPESVRRGRMPSLFFDPTYSKFGDNPKCHGLMEKIGPCSIEIMAAQMSTKTREASKDPFCQRFQASDNGSAEMRISAEKQIEALRHELARYNALDKI